MTPAPIDARTNAPRISRYWPGNAAWRAPRICPMAGALASTTMDAPTASAKRRVRISECPLARVHIPWFFVVWIEEICTQVQAPDGEPDDQTTFDLAVGLVHPRALCHQADAA